MMNQTQQQGKLCLRPVEAEVEPLLRALAHTAPCSSDQHHRPSPPPLRHWQENGHLANELDLALKWQRGASFEFLERSCLLCSNMEAMGTAIPEITALPT